MLTSSLHNSLSRSLSNSLRNASFGGLLPPVSTKLLAWHKGVVQSEIYLRDSAQKLGDFALQMVDGPCLTFDGVGEYGNVGVISDESKIEFGATFTVGAVGLARTVVGRFFSQDEILVSSLGDVFVRVNNVQSSSLISVNEGDVVTVHCLYNLASVVVTINGIEVLNTPQTGAILNNSQPWQCGASGNSADRFNGTVWAVTFNDTFFPCIGKTSTVNPTTTSATDGTVMTIVSLDYAAIWAGVQQSYFWEVANGYAERENYFTQSEDIDEWVTWNTVTRVLEGDTWRITYDDPSSLRQEVPGQGYTVAAFPQWQGMTALIPTEKPLFNILVDSNGTEWWMIARAATDTDTTTIALSAVEVDTGVLRISFEKPASTSLEFLMRDASLTLADRSNMTQPSVIVCQGDSISTGYPTHLQRIMKDSTIINSATGGDRIQDCIDNFATDIAAYNPDQIILMIGANDLSKITVSEIKALMLTLLALCDSTGADTLLGLITPLGNSTWWTQSMQDDIEELNPWLQTLGYPIVDTYTVLLQDGSTTTMEPNYTEDYVHPVYANELLADNFAFYFGFEYPLYLKTGANRVIEGRQPTPADVPAGWNLPQNKFEMPYTVTTKAQDDLEGPFWFTGTTPNPKTQAEIEVYVEGKSATMIKKCKTSMDELLRYNEVLEGEELIRVLYYCCAAEPIAFDNEKLTFDDEETFMRN